MISERTVHRILKKTTCPRTEAVIGSNAKIEDADQCEQQIETICEVYLTAVANETKGIHTVSVDEKTGIQALGRESPTIPMSPGKVEHIEYNDERRGTTICLAI